jgi:hydrogenase maturation protease
VTIREFAGAPLDFISEIQGWPRVIAVDAVVAGNVPPGTVLVFGAAELQTNVLGAYPHGLNLPEALALARRLHLALPEQFVLIGIAVEAIVEFGETLSPALAGQFDEIYRRVAAAIRHELKI